MPKILLVEDDNNLREIYEARLMAEGYTIVTAPDGEAALAVASQEKPDLVVSDVMMPNISGFDMLDIMRNTEGLKHVKVIMLTALSQAEDKARAEALGADKYLVKSQVTLEDIVNFAKELLGDSPAPATPEAAPAAPAPVAAAVDVAVAPAPTPVATEPVAVAPTPVMEVAMPPAAEPQPTPVAVAPEPSPAPVAAAPVVTEQVAPTAAAPVVVDPPVAAEPAAPIAQPATPAPSPPVTVTVSSMPDPVTPTQPPLVPINVSVPGSTPLATTPVPESTPVAQPAPEIATPPAEPASPLVAAEQSQATSLSQSTETEEQAIQKQIDSFADSLPTDAPQQVAPTTTIPEQNDQLMAAAVDQLNTSSQAPAEVPLASEGGTRVVPSNPPPDAQPTPAILTTAPPANAEPLDVVIDKPVMAEAASTRKKVIQPLHDPEAAPDLNALLAAEEARQQAANPMPPTPIINGQPAGQPVVQNTPQPGTNVRPEDIAL